MNTSRTFAQILLVAVLSIAVATPTSAQSPEPSTMVLGYVGGVSDGGGTTFGGAVHFPLASRLVLSTEAGYLTGGEDFSGFGVDVDLHAISVDANVHYQFPLSGNAKFTPYVLGGIGYLRVSSSVSVGGFDAGASSSTTGLNIGGGGLWHMNAKWSLRPEVKILVADGSNVRFSVGFGYRLGS